MEAREKKELIGEIIYPLAKRLYSNHAAKLTGMLLEAILKLQNDELIKEIIASRNTIDELVREFGRKKGGGERLDVNFFLNFLD